MIVAPFAVYALMRRGYFQKLYSSRIPNAGVFHPAASRNWEQAPREEDFTRLRYYSYDTYARRWDEVSSGWNPKVLD